MSIFNDAFLRENNSPTVVQAGGERMKLEELLSRSEALARLLEDAGCRQGDLFCSIMDKTLDFLISVLGINKAGGLCVPVDPHCSKDRLQAFLFDSGARWIIADEHATSLLKSFENQGGSLNMGWMGARKNLPPGISPEFVRKNISGYSGDGSLEETDPSAPAFMFYDTGGKLHMEAFLLSNSEMCDFAEKISVFMDIRREDRIAGFMPAFRPPFLLELLVPFYHPASFHSFNAERLSDMGQVLNALKKHDITQFLCRSEDLSALASGYRLNGYRCSSVRQVMLWGKPPSRKRFSLLRELFPNCRIKNFYSVSKARSYNMDHSSAAEKQPAAHFSDFQKERLLILADEHSGDRFNEVDSLPEMMEMDLACWRTEDRNRSALNTKSAGNIKTNNQS